MGVGANFTLLGLGKFSQLKIPAVSLPTAVTIFGNHMHCVSRFWILAIARSLVMLMICVTLGVAPTSAQPAPPSTSDLSSKNILLLYSYGHGGKGIGLLDEGLLSALERGGIRINNLFFEYLDLERNKVDPHYGQRLQELLTKKYAARSIDLILTVQQPAQKWLMNEGKNIAPDAVAITVHASASTMADAGHRRLVSEFATLDIKGTLENALKLFPDTKRVVFVSGNSEVDKQIAAAAARASDPWKTKLTFEHTTDMALDAMLAHVVKLPANTIVIFTQFTRDSKGHVTVPYEVEASLIKAANAPVFGLYDFNLINGGIGGSVVSVKGLGERTGQLMLDLLSGKLQLQQAVTRVDYDAIPMFDWAQIQRWGADPDRLPKNTIFVNHVPSVLEQYGSYVVGVTVFIAALFLLITSLFVSRRRHALTEESLRESESRYRTLIEHAPDAIVIFDLDTGRFADCNMAAQKLFGCTGEDLLKGGPEVFYPPEQLQNRSSSDVIAQVSRQVMAGEDVEFERIVRQPHGKELVCEARLVRLPAADRRLIRISYLDITERKRSEEALRIAATAFESQLGMIVTNTDGVILRVNKAFTDITGYAAKEVIGQNPRILASGRHNISFYAAMWSSITECGSWQGEIWNRHKDCREFPEWLTISAVKNEAGLPTHYVGTFSDITARKSAEEEISNLAFYDPLTKLPNRRLLLDRLAWALASGSRHERKAAMLFVDLDNFKTLNDTLGHANGDLLLQQVAHRLSACVREGDTVARLGGDEFVVMLEDLSENVIEAATQAEVTGEKILATLSQTYLLAGVDHHSTASIGVTLFGDKQEDTDEPLKRADLAMYQAKAAGRNTLRFFDPQMQAVVSARAALENDLRLAIDKDQFLLHYQVQVADDDVITGVEALVRWQHPLRGMISPASFIPLAEDSGLILPLGLWVLRAACAQLATWAKAVNTRKLTIAVNVSSRQFHQVDFVDQVLAVINETGANPHRLKLELTESLLIDDVENVIAKMTALREVGVGFSLDDFGTGYSSLAYLKLLPLDQLKIDQGFVRDVLTDANDAAIAKLVIVLAQSLGLMVIAEGVETEAQRDFLASQGCRAYQGYLFGRPLPIDELTVLFSENGRAVTEHADELSVCGR
jgi:diguanylate cyclase (GGDEF)-like protein/PAS domain S-box-containing protein